MRLKQIKLAGFKSFVDPTKIPFPNPLTAIIGPNGCGKSNVIDAVRWVLGESSAKHLRGDSMTDVIFNGSSARRPVSVAGVELVFDNREGRLGGQYASYEEIAVKRQVSREGESLYFLNGQKCRRKDITDLFMGTGLGPRSYAIIEQGMISRLIESRPQELRVFIEEAAGISRYKERRRDTENRIRHTRENLERLGDIRLELGKQLDKLAVQAEAAKRYREYKQSERTTHAELLVMRYQEICEQTDMLDREIEQQHFLLEAAKTALGTTEANLEAERQALAVLVDDEQQSLEAYYQAGTEVARLEQQLSNLDERSKSLQSRLESLSRDMLALDESNRELGETQASLRLAVEAGEEQLLTLEETQEAWSQSAFDADEALEAVRGDVSQAERALAKLKSQKELTGQRLGHLRHSIDEREHSLAGYREQLASLGEQESPADNPAPKPQGDFAAEQGISALPTDTTDNDGPQADLHQQQAAVDVATAALKSAQAQLADVDNRIAAKSRELSEVRGRLSVLTRLLTEESGSGQKLWQCLEVEPGWEAAAELLLGRLLDAPVIEQAPEANSPGFTRQTASQWGVIGADVNLAPWLDGVGFAKSLGEAQAKLQTLGSNGLIVCREGFLVGQGFILSNQSGGTDKVALRSEAEALEQEVASLEAALATLGSESADASRTLEASTAALKVAELALSDAKQEAERERMRWEARRESARQAAKQREFVSAQIARLSAQQQEALLELEVADESLMQQEEALEEASARVAALTEKQTAARRLAEERKASLANLESQLAQVRAKRSELATELALVDQKLQSGQLQLGKLTEQKGTVLTELGQQDVKEQDTDRTGLSERLREQLGMQQSRQTALAENRSRQAALQEQIDALLLKQKQEVGKIDHLTHTLESLKLRREGLKGQAETQLGQLAEADIRLAEVAPALPAHASVDEWQQRLEKLRGKISRLGAINLAAIEEYDEARERKDYLDGQDADLNQALESLEEAIRKIDRETRSRFKTTFEQVNADLGMLFPKVFGGGSAYLALTDDDLLETGVTIMARPPGKKNSTIHLLSGGEKALTALSLVFAIFRLNPAPFCMLDEVDAPLDDANVDRFCRLLQEMSASVQFIYISHNKITMEMADQLVGVTMHEPGVSRIVAVDIEEAVAMAHAE
ncbi:chromosome segregation protein SMC [Shewanella sp. 3B26]|uniref:Chromosome partition protein Smc n=1 Tax=Shewanella zhuhaiensis TaxID=2919576 RepID=A0AAJ1FCU3_9GAMM|nr:chromosome segregation protein SMC [Shewanella zhuhaiensis]MCH4296270.1 chromosome segregation protein SMC [Shewanella zhuhaiensis]